MNVSLTPWKRFGHDRIYVTVDGRKLGYRDTVNGTEHPEHQDDAALLTALLEAHLAAANVSTSRVDRGLAGREAAAARLDVVEEHEPATEPVRGQTAQEDLSWTDLARNVPGQAARERATEEWESRRAATPVRAVLGRLLNVHTDERAWRIGADGEAHVGAKLEKLARKDPRWRVLHAVPVGERGSDIDHVVISPAGVFAINTKHHPRAKVWVGKDQLRVNGHTQPYIRNSRFEAKRAAKTLTVACGFDVRVDALVVLFGVVDIAVKTEPEERTGARCASCTAGSRPGGWQSSRRFSPTPRSTRSTKWRGAPPRGCDCAIQGCATAGPQRGHSAGSCGVLGT